MVSYLRGLDLGCKPLGVDPLVLPIRGRVVESPPKPGIIDQVKALYRTHIPYSVRSKVPQIKGIARKSVSVASSGINIVLPLISTVRSGANAVSKGGCKFIRAMRKSKVIAPLALVSTAVGIAESVQDVAKAVKEKNSNDGVEAGLTIVEHVSDVAFIGESLVAGLSHFEVIAPHATAVASVTLVGVGGVLSLASVALSSKHLHDSIKYRKEMMEKFNGKSDEKNVDEVANFIQGSRKRDIKKRFGVSSGGEFKARLQGIFEKSKDGTVESKEKAEKTVGLLKKRLFSKELGSVLKIIAGIVSIAGLVVLLLFPPLMPIGYGLCAVAGIIGISALIHDLVVSYKFEKEIKKLSPDISDKESRFLKHYQWQKRKDKWKELVEPIKSWEPERVA